MAALPAGSSPPPRLPIPSAKICLLFLEFVLEDVLTPLGKRSPHPGPSPAQLSQVNSWQLGLPQTIPGPRSSPLWDLYLGGETGLFTLMFLLDSVFCAQSEA